MCVKYLANPEKRINISQGDLKKLSRKLYFRQNWISCSTIDFIWEAKFKIVEGVNENMNSIEAF